MQSLVFGWMISFWEQLDGWKKNVWFGINGWMDGLWDGWCSKHKHHSKAVVI